MEAGTLRHQVTVQQQVTGAPDGMGNVYKVWTDLYANVPASIEPYTSKEIYAGQQVQTYTSHRVTLRYLTGLTTQMRVTWGSRKFTINGLVNKDERNIMVTLQCLEDFSNE